MNKAEAAQKRRSSQQEVMKITICFQPRYPGPDVFVCFRYAVWEYPIKNKERHN